MRGDRKKQQELVDEKSTQQVADSKVIDIKIYKPKRIPQLMWLECNKKVWEIDPLNCPKCAGEMRVISFIYQRQVIRKIFEHLKIYEEKKQRAPPLKKAPVKEVELVSFNDGWPGYEDPVFEI